jgi:hypothetical protein
MFWDGPSGLPAARCISVTQKSLGIPAIRETAFIPLSAEMAKICQYFRILAAPLCQADLFHVGEICRLNPSPHTFKKLFPAAIPHRGARD